MHQNTKQNYRDRSRSIEKTENNHCQNDLPTLKKKCCKESQIQRSLKEVHDYRQINNIRLRSKSGAVPNPIMSYDDLDEYPQLLKRSLNQSGFKGPTIIQSMAWPIILNGHDLIGIAQTGSGKTLAYLLPGLIHVIEQQSSGAQMLVLAPTRELTVQIFNQFTQYSNSLKAACLYGGQEKYIQRNQLRQNPQIIIACPGRLLDFCNSGDVSLATVGFWVLDEADMMLDMGFEPQVRQIEQQIRRDRQTVLLSATWPKSIEKLALQFCIEEPIQLVIGNQELTVNLSIRQEIIVLHPRDKQRCLKNILQDLSREKCIIFGAKKVEIENIAQFVKSCGLSARAIHGDKVQKERDEILNQFKDDRFSVLVATDVASRGLDIRNVKYVINYDMPKHIEDYIHRIGRTARAGAEGTAISLFSMETDSKLVPELCKLLKEAQQDVPREFKSRF